MLLRILSNVGNTTPLFMSHRRGGDEVRGQRSLKLGVHVEQCRRDFSRSDPVSCYPDPIDIKTAIVWTGLYTPKKKHEKCTVPIQQYN